MLNGQEMLALDDIASMFQVTVREDALAGGLTLTYKGRTVVVSPDQPMASINGRVVSLPLPAVRAGRRWLVPVEFLPRALAPIYDSRIELRRPSRLLLLGDVRVPRVAARIDAVGPPSRATVEIAPATPTTVVVEGGRITIKIDADALDPQLPAGGGGLIDSIRVGDSPTALAIVLSPRYTTARAVPVTMDNVTRVAIEVASAATQTEVAPPPVPIAPGPRDEGLAASAISTVAIDPGHGGDDVGVRSASGVLEKQITLEVARRLRTLLETRLGLRVILTREDDRGLTLDERAAVANNSKAELFVSLHMNAAPASGVAGAEIFTLEIDRDAEMARQLAAADGTALPVQGGEPRPIDVIRWDLAQARHVEASTVFAATMEAELRKHVPMGPRPIQQGPMRVLAAADMPAALLEIAYLSNPAQERTAQSAEFQTVVAQALFDAVVRMRAYLEERHRP
jgi:N-acetylmuramoyl-L-alanine amidase